MPAPLSSFVNNTSSLAFLLLLLLLLPPMVIYQQPESVGATATATVQSESCVNRSSVRRRPGAAATSATSLEKVELDAFEGESSSEELVRDSSSDDNHHHNEVDDNDAAAKANREEHVADVSAVKFAYRPSFPAHRKIKESPLSSANIFRQVHPFFSSNC